MAAPRPALLLQLALALLAAHLVSAFVPAAPTVSSRSGRAQTRLHVLDPASLPDPSTVDAAVTATQQVQQAVVSNGPNQVVDALKNYVFSPSGFGATGLLALGMRAYTYFTVRCVAPRTRRLNCHEIEFLILNDA